MASPWLRLLSLWAAAAVLLAVVSGAGELGAAHDGLAALALPPLAALVVAAWFRHRRCCRTRWPRSASSAPPPTSRRAASIWRWRRRALAAALVVAALVHRERWVPFGAVRDYIALTKPRIMSLLLLTGFCGLVAGAGGLPPWEITVAAMLGLALACGGASALNHVLDRDIDRLMGQRTRKRPVAADRLSASHALEFGLALSALSFTVLAGAVNVLTAVLALVGNLFYVLVYTGWLKRSTPQNIVIGGAAGAVPPLVGWAAATGSLALPALGALPHRLPLDAAALLGARAAHQARLRGGGDSRCCPSCAATPRRRGRSSSTRWRSWRSPSSRSPPAGSAPCTSVRRSCWARSSCGWRCGCGVSIQPARASALFHYSLLYLALLFVAAADRPGGHLMDPELERKNLVLGLWLFGFSLALLVLTAVIAIVVVYG